MFKNSRNRRVIGEDQDRLDNLLHGTDETDDIRETQNGNSRLLNVGPRVALKFLVSNNLAGALIGKGGASVNALQNETGARIKIALSSDIFPGTQELTTI